MGYYYMVTYCHTSGLIDIHGPYSTEGDAIHAGQSWEDLTGRPHWWVSEVPPTVQLTPSNYIADWVEENVP